MNAIYKAVKLSTPDVARRPNPDSKRTRVLRILQAHFIGRRKAAVPIEVISIEVGFDARPHLQKLAFQGWAHLIS